MISLLGRRAWVFAGVAAGGCIGVLLLALWFGGATPQPPIPGLPAPGALTGWGLPLARLAVDLSAIATVGTLLTGVVLAPRAAGVVRIGGWWALGWAVSAAGAYVLTMSDFFAVPVLEIVSDESSLTYGVTVPQGLALLVVVAAALLIAVGSRARPTRWGGAALLVVAVFALLPTVYVGHAASAGDHDLAVSGLMTHVVAVAVWVGGLFGTAAYLRRSDRLLAVAVPRLSTLALCCFVAVGLSGVASGWVRLDAVSDLWQSRYGLLLIGKSVLLAVLGVFGWMHRRRTVAAIGRWPARRLFARLAAAEIAVMAAAVALAVALSRTPPPPSAGQHGHDLLEYDLEPYTIGRLLTEVRIDPLIVLVLLGMAAAYLVGVRRVLLGGDRWPPRYLLAWAAGLYVLAFVLISGVGAYARAMFAVHAAQYATLNVAVPLLLVLGAPLTLAAQALSPASQYGRASQALLDGGVARTISHPVVAAGIYCLPYPLLYLTGWLQLALSSHAVHLLTQALFVATGLVFFWVVIGLDPLPRPVSWNARIGMLATAAATHLLVGVGFFFGPMSAEEWFFLVAPLGGLELLADQHLGATVATGCVIVVLAAVALWLAVRRRAARRRMAQMPAAPAARTS